MNETEFFKISIGDEFEAKRIGGKWKKLSDNLAVSLRYGTRILFSALSVVLIEEEMGG